MIAPYQTPRFEADQMIANIRAPAARKLHQRDGAFWSTMVDQEISRI
jgi:hypothetical protein